MTNKYFFHGKWMVAFSVLLAGVLFSCAKGDDTYRNYQNGAGRFNGNTLAYLQSQPGVYDSMLLVVNRLTGVRDSISQNNLTVFAINNRSFSLALQNINQARKDSI